MIFRNEIKKIKTNIDVPLLAPLSKGRGNKKQRLISVVFVLVPERGLEPPRIAALGPKPSVSTNFTTPALY